MSAHRNAMDDAMPTRLITHSTSGSSAMNWRANFTSTRKVQAATALAPKKAPVINTKAINRFMGTDHTPGEHHGITKY